MKWWREYFERILNYEKLFKLLVVEFGNELKFKISCIICFKIKNVMKKKKSNEVVVW